MIMIFLILYLLRAFSSITLKENNDLVCIRSNDKSNQIIAKHLFHSYSNQINEKLQQIINYLDGKEFSEEKLLLKEKGYNWQQYINDEDLLYNWNLFYFIFDDFAALNFSGIYKREIENAIQVFLDEKRIKTQFQGAKQFYSLKQLLIELQQQVLPNIYSIIEKSFIFDEKEYLNFLKKYDNQIFSKNWNISKNEYPFKNTIGTKMFELDYKMIFNPSLLFKNMQKIIENIETQSESSEISILIDCHVDHLVLNYVKNILKGKKSSKLIKLNDFLTCELDFMKSDIDVENFYKQKNSSKFVRMIKFLLKKFKKLCDAISLLSVSNNNPDFESSELKKLLIFQLEKIRKNIFASNLSDDKNSICLETLKKFLLNENTKIEKLVFNKFLNGKDKKLTGLSKFLEEELDKTMNIFTCSKKNTNPSVLHKSVNITKKFITTDNKCNRNFFKTGILQLQKKVALKLHFVNYKSFEINQTMISSLSYLTEITPIEFQRFFEITKNIKKEFPVYISKIFENLSGNEQFYSIEVATQMDFGITNINNKFIEQINSNKKYLTYPKKDIFNMKKMRNKLKTNYKKIDFKSCFACFSCPKEYDEESTRMIDSTMSIDDYETMN